MNTKTKRMRIPLLLGALLLAAVNSAGARDILIQNGQVNLSTISPAPTAADTISISQNGLLLIDGNATVGQIMVGDANTAGGVQFDHTERVLTISAGAGQSGSVLFGALGGNTLDMSDIVNHVQHKMYVAGSFLSSGNGVFNAGGTGWVIYNGGAQSITAKINNSATIVYNNLGLAGAGAGNVKTLQPGLLVNGILQIGGTASVTGSAVNYGPASGGAKLVYGWNDGSDSGQITTPLEFPASMAVPVTLNNPSGLTLDGNKVITPLSPIVDLTIKNGDTLDDGGFTLAVNGDIVNKGSHTGTGAIVLAGSAPQTLSGPGGNYGNLVVNNNATLSDNTTINGRLIINSPALLGLADGTHSYTVLMTFLGSDVNVGVDTTYGSTAATGPGVIRNDSVFAFPLKGLLTLRAKPASNITAGPPVFNGAPQDFYYGGTGLKIVGNVNGGTDGNTARQGEHVFLKLGTNPAIYSEQTGGPVFISANGGAFEWDIPDAIAQKIPAGTYQIFGGYSGGINLAPLNQNLTDSSVPVGTLTVKQLWIVIKPTDVSKRYGDVDPVLSYTGTWGQYCPLPPCPGQNDVLTVPLPNGDRIVGALHRATPGGTLNPQSNENVGAYAIDQGTLAVDPPSSQANYQFRVLSGQSLTIIQLPITVTAAAKSKTFGQPDPALTYNFTPPLHIWSWTDPAQNGNAANQDAFTGSLASAGLGGAHPGVYAITQGGLDIITPLAQGIHNYVINFVGANLTVSPAQISVVVNTKHKLYGNHDPCSSVETQFNDFACILTVNPPSAQSSLRGYLTRNAGENVGSYTIDNSLNTLSAGPDYTISSLTAGKLVIDPRPINVSGLNVLSTYGQVLSHSQLISYSFPDPFVNSPLNPIPTQPQTPAIPGGWSPIPLEAPGLTPLSDPAWPTGNEVPGVYAFTPTGASDPNMIINVVSSGQITISKADLNVYANDKTKVSDNRVFNPALFDYRVLPFREPLGWAVNGDNPQNSFAPYTLIQYTGDAVTATLPGVYQIIPNGDTTLLSLKYNVHFFPGKLTITGPLTAQGVSSAVWTGGSHFDWEIDNANFGTPGNNPGWSLLTVSGALDLSGLSAANPFNINVITIDPTGRDQNGDPFPMGRAAKFDPTRPYAFKFVQAGSVIFPAGGFNPNLFNVTLDQLVPGLVIDPEFQNLFGDLTLDQFGVSHPNTPSAWGQWGVDMPNPNELDITWTPIGFAPALHRSNALLPFPGGFEVGDKGVFPFPVDDLTHPTTPGTLLGEVAPYPVTNPKHDLPTLTLDPNKTVVMPQNDHLTVALNLRNVPNNVPKAITAVQAFIRFSSSFFIASAQGSPGAPAVAGGTGDWGEPIWTVSYVGGELDMVIGVSLPIPGGTLRDGTVAFITLTPTRTATGTSRVMFREDKNPADAGGAATDNTYLWLSDNSTVLPARVDSDEITVQNDSAAPQLGITALQHQQFGDLAYDSVKKDCNVYIPDPEPAGFPEKITVRSFAPTTQYPVGGAVRITVTATDNGVGLANNNPVTVGLYNPSHLNPSGPPFPAPDVSLSASSVSGTPSQSVFEFDWLVTAATQNGYWTALVTASDNYSPAHVAYRLFYLHVNKNQIQGIVELDSFVGQTQPDYTVKGTRTVTFNSAAGSPGAISHTWDLPLTFGYGPYPTANGGLGNFADRQGLANLLNAPAQADTVSAYLRYGTINNLPELVARILIPPGPPLPGPLYTYLRGLWFGDILNQPLLNLRTIASKLVQPTRPIDAYIYQHLSGSTINALNNFLGGGNAFVAKALLLNDFNAIILGPSIWQPERFDGVTTTPADNATLLNLAYPEFIVPQLNPLTASLMLQYSGSGPSPALLFNLLADLDDLVVTPQLWTDPSGPNAGLYSDARFLYVVLASDTHALVERVEANLPTDVWQLNRLLLRDGLGGEFSPAPLSTTFVEDMLAYLGHPTDPGAIAAFDAQLTADLNALITTTIIYDPARFAGVSLNQNIQALLRQNPAAGSPNGIELNRRLLEAAYPTQISKNSLTFFLLTDVPDGTTQISAKTKWNLRSRLTLSAPVTAAAPDGYLYFVNGGVIIVNPNGILSRPNSHLLLAGDMSPDVNGLTTGDNVINLIDYNTIKRNWPTAIPAPLNGGAIADLDGNGTVNMPDYFLLRANWGKTGDPEAGQ